jgi:hypothetical protein
LELQAFVDAAGTPEAARSRIALVRLEDVQKHRSNLKLGMPNGEIFLVGSVNMISLQSNVRETLHSFMARPNFRICVAII